MGTDTLHDLTAAYALDALDETERREYEAHLAHCQRCRADLGSFSDAATALAYGVAGPQPPPQLRSRILDRARAERPNVVPLRPRWAVPAAVTAVAAVAATVALAIWVTSLSNHVDSLQSQRDSQEHVAAVLASPGARVFQFGKDGRLVVTREGEAALVFRRLAPARRGMTYEAWVARGGKPAPAGTFDGSGGATSVVLTKRVPNGGSVLVTQERAPGTRQPEHQPILSATT
ncbi:MAG TPA: anti-sigma factor [Gaiellaceae bacterium]|jgi:anti-sigma factor RsiW|nr:anti-sigma factor [Gaiellaceae bacterium]